MLCPNLLGGYRTLWQAELSLFSKLTQEPSFLHGFKAFCLIHLKNVSPAFLPAATSTSTWGVNKFGEKPENKKKQQQQKI